MKKDNIEEIYKELEGYSEIPPAELWDNIEARLHPKKKRRGALWFWGSSAAILVVMLGYMIYKPIDGNINIPSSNSDNEITGIKHSDDTINDKTSDYKSVISDVEVTVNNKTEDSLEKESEASKSNFNRATYNNQLVKRDGLEHKSKNQIDKTSNQKLHDKTLDKKVKASNLTEDYAQNIDTNNDTKNKKDAFNLKDDSKNLIEDAEKVLVADIDSISKAKTDTKLDLYKELMAENSKEEDTLNTAVAGINKWSVEVLGGLSNTTSKSTIQGTSVNTSPQNNFVYTLKVGYSLSDKLVIKTGIGKNTLGQEVNNIVYTSSDISAGSTDLQSIVSNQNIQIFGSQESYTEVSNSPDNINQGNFEQRFDYVQLPLEVSYSLLKKPSFDLSVGLGGNINFLTNNRAYLNDEEVGESLGVNRTVFGGAINSNISYKLANKTILFLEPSYNYFQRPVDNSNQKFNNTQLRVLFGLQFKF